VLVGIDHLVVAVADPDAAARELQLDLGLAAGPGGRHEAWGTRNSLVWLGDTYLELIGVTDRALAAGSWIGRPVIARLEAAGPGLATFALASDDLGADLARLRDQGAALDGPSDGERTRPDGRVVRWRLALPPRLGPDEPPFLIEHDATAAEWTPDDRAARAAAGHPIGGPVRLRVLDLPVPAASVAARTMALLRACDLRFRPSLAGRGARDASVGPAQLLRIRPAPAGSPPVLHLSVPGAAGRTVDALGLRVTVGR
jgi:hypothetical protein